MILHIEFTRKAHIWCTCCEKFKLATVENVPSSVTSASQPSRTGPLGNRSQTTSSSLATVLLCTSASCSPNSTNAVQIKHGSTLLPPNFEARVTARASAPVPSNNMSSNVRTIFFSPRGWFETVVQNLMDRRWKKMEVRVGGPHYIKAQNTDNIISKCHKQTIKQNQRPG